MTEERERRIKSVSRRSDGRNIVDVVVVVVVVVCIAAVVSFCLCFRVSRYGNGTCSLRRDGS